MFKAIAVAVALAATTAVAGAQATSTYKGTAKPAAQQSATTKRHVRTHKTTTQAQLQKEAKISEATARETALKEVPNGSVKSSELERENGKLIYSYDITVPGKTGVDEVNVNAIDGTVVAKTHETPKAEKAEMAKEAKAKTVTKK
jgi:uncharacterized membrane protein YkoI